MKQCKYCGKMYDENFFGICNTINGKIYRRLKCNSCYYKTKNLLRRNKRNEIKKLKKTLKCSICGNNDYRVLHFHHKNKDKKDFNVSEGMISKSMKDIYKEIKKCKILCANCHAILHYKE